VSDQWSTYGTKILVPVAREAHFALDEFLGNATDLPITEHATDTHGATLINFGLFDLVGKALTPRMRDLTKITLVRDDTPTEIGKLYPNVSRSSRSCHGSGLYGFEATERLAGQLR
jgi:TnpA family transposase